jgi:hypothetical protein
MALRTGTSLEPELVPDPQWVEAELLGQCGDVLRALVATTSTEGRTFPDLESLATAAHSVADSVYSVARLHQGPTALELTKLLADITAPARLVPIRPADGERIAANATRIADSVGFALASLVVGTTEAIIATTPDALRAYTASINWRRPRSLYSRPRPQRVSEELERLFNSIAFERAAEGEVITQTWYVAEQLARTHYDYFAGQLEDIVSTTAAITLAASPDGCHPFPAVQLLVRGEEVASKLLHHEAGLTDAFSRLATLNASQDYKWRRFDTGSLRASILRLQRSIALGLARLLPSLSAIPPARDLPDQFGLAYTKTAEALVDSLALGDSDLFGQLYPLFFDAAQAAPLRLLQQDAIQDPTWLAVLALDPLTDLLDLSGLAILFRALGRESKPAEAVTATWDERLAAPAFAARIMDSAAQVEVPPLFAIPPRSFSRHRWKQLLFQILEEEDLRRASAGQAESGTASPVPLIAAYAPTMGYSHYEPRDAFFATYLFARRDWGTRSQGRRASELLASISSGTAGDDGE